MSDENVGGLVAKWRAEADINAPRLLHPEACEAKRECADELEATLSAHGGLLFTQGDMERFAGYVADAREERLKSAHGQPVVDEAMVERAMDAFASVRVDPNSDTLDHDLMRAALTAALGATP